jgi:TnpA family transposase
MSSPSQPFWASSSYRASAICHPSGSRVFEQRAVPKELKGLISGKVRENIITANWPDILRSAATMVTGVMPPSQLLRKFVAYPRQHELAEALKEIGRVERTLFIINWLIDADMQRRAQIGLNKGEAHHALKNALRILTGEYRWKKR